MNGCLWIILLFPNVVAKLRRGCTLKTSRLCPYKCQRSTSIQFQGNAVPASAAGASAPSAAGHAIEGDEALDAELADAGAAESDGVQPMVL